MSRFKVRFEEADFKMFGGGGGYMVVGGWVVEQPTLMLALGKSLSFMAFQWPLKAF